MSVLNVSNDASSNFILFSSQTFADYVSEEDDTTSTLPEDAACDNENQALCGVATNDFVAAAKKSASGDMSDVSSLLELKE